MEPKTFSPLTRAPRPFYFRFNLLRRPAWSGRRLMFLLSACMALQMTGYVMILPLFARRFSDFGAGVEALGASSLAYALASTLTAPFMGALADRLGRRPIVLGSLGAYLLAFCSYLFANSAGTFILVRALAGALTAGLIPAVLGTAADLAPNDRRAQWIGFVNGGASVGWIDGPLLGGLLYDGWGYVTPFALSIALEVIALGVAIFSIPETRQDQVARLVGSSRKGGVFQVGNLKAGYASFRDSLPNSLPAFGVLLGISFMTAFAWAFIEPQFMFYAYDGLNWSSSQLGWMMSIYGAALMAGEFTLGRLSDRLGRKPVLVLGMVLFSAQFLGLAFLRDAFWIGLAFLLAGLGNALFDPALSAHLLDIVPGEHKARFLGIKSTAASLGALLGPAQVVLAASFMGPHEVFLVASASVVVLTLASAAALTRPVRSSTSVFYSPASQPTYR